MTSSWSPRRLLHVPARRALLLFCAVSILLTVFLFWEGTALRTVRALRGSSLSAAWTSPKDPPRILLVSAFFPLAKSKHPMSDYEAWLSGFLGAVTTDVYFFCSPDLAPLIERLRGDLPVIINTTFNTPFDVPPLKGLEARYEEMHAWDPESDIHGSELYAVWNAKAYFLEEGMLNAGERKGEVYDYAFWNDAGSLREARPYRAWPDPLRVDQVFAEGAKKSGTSSDELVFFPVWNPPREEYGGWKEEDGPLDAVDSFSEGSFFGGHPGAVAQYRKLFFAYHDMWLKQDKFVGKDQNVINALMMLFPEHFIGVWLYDQKAPAGSGVPSNTSTPLGECGSTWWYYQWWLASAEEQEAKTEEWLGSEWTNPMLRAKARCRVTRVVAFDWLLATRAFPAGFMSRWSHPGPSIPWDH